jgi:hypothetical protein
MTVQVAYGQDTKLFKGAIVNSETLTALGSVVCKTFDGNDKMLSYGFSDGNGHFVLKDGTGAAAFLVFEYLGYKRQKIAVGDIKDHDNITVRLEEEPVALKEITVTVPPVVRRNDTVIYNVSSFEGQEDRYLVDILKKLPGISVSENGVVSYQGESINKFYIEGHDLLGGQYGLATNNLTKDAVSQVQVLENHQPVKALKDLQRADKAAINIKLKKGYISRPFGEIKAGAGLSPLLYDEKLFAAQIGTRLQTLANLRINNAGIDISKELDEKISVSGRNFDIPPEDMILQEDIQTLPINRKRYLFNRSYAGSVNNLFALSKDTELKLNLSYTNDRVQQDFAMRQTYATGTDELIINRYESQLNKIVGYRASLALEHNASNKYLRNELKFTGKGKDNNSEMNTDTRNQKVRTDNRSLNFQNDFQGLLKFKNNKTLNVSSYLRYLDKSEDLYLTLTEIRDSSILSETFSGNYFLTKNGLSTSFDLFRQQFGIELDVEYELNGLKGELPDIEVADLNLSSINNQMETFRSNLSFRYQIKSRKRTITNINIPVTYHRYTVRNRYDKPLTNSRIVPNISIMNAFKINNLWELKTGLGYHWNYGDCLPLLGNAFFRSDRTIYIPSGTIGERGSYSASVAIKHGNLSELFFFNLAIIYGINQSNYIPKTYNTQDLSYYTTEAGNNTENRLSLNANISKSFVPTGLALTVTPDFTQNKALFMQQNILMENTSNTARLSLKLEYKNLANTGIVYHAAGGMHWNDNSYSDRMILKNSQQRITVFYFPKKNIDISADFDYTLYEIEKNRYSSCYFFDLKCRYKYKIIEFEFAANNIFDNTAYSITYLSTVNSTFQSLPIRGREFLLSATLKF